VAGGGAGVAALHGELAEPAPRGRARGIELHGGGEPRIGVAGPQRADIGLRRAHEPGRDRGGVAGGVGVIGERAEEDRRLAPQPALEAAIAERERDE
jgi:hypothetical protein